MFAARNCVTARLSRLCNGESNTSTSPRSTPSVPAITLSSVVLPQPDGPTNMSNSPVRASKLTSLSTSVRVSPAPNPLQTVFVLTATLFIYFGFCYAPFLTLHPRGENSSSVLRGVGALTLTPNLNLTPTFPCQPA